MGGLKVSWGLAMGNRTWAGGSGHESSTKETCAIVTRGYRIPNHIAWQSKAGYSYWYVLYSAMVFGR